MENGISGFLVSTRDQLIQLIEGKQEDVNKLFDVIRKDKRHHHITIEFEGFSNQRCMPFLGMGLCFNYMITDLDYKFYFTKDEAKDFSWLIQGKVGQVFKEYLA